MHFASNSTKFRKVRARSKINVGTAVTPAINFLFRAVAFLLPRMPPSTISTHCRSFFRLRCQSSLHQSPIRIKIIPDEHFIPNKLSIAKRRCPPIDHKSLAADSDFCCGQLHRAYVVYLPQGSSHPCMTLSAFADQKIFGSRPCPIVVSQV